MAAFEPAFEYLMKHEDSTLSGKITSEPNGGFARLGINSCEHPEAAECGFYKMPVADAILYASGLFRRQYFEPIGGFQIADQNVANKFFDLAVNSGITEGTKIVQRAVNSVMTPEQQPLNVDGKSGLRTIDVINHSMPADLLAAIRSYATQFYKDLANRQPKFKPYLAGWLVRVEG